MPHRHAVHNAEIRIGLCLGRATGTGCRGTTMWQRRLVRNGQRVDWIARERTAIKIRRLLQREGDGDLVTPFVAGGSNVSADPTPVEVLRSARGGEREQ